MSTATVYNCHQWTAIVPPVRIPPEIVLRILFEHQYYDFNIWDQTPLSQPREAPTNVLFKNWKPWRIVAELDQKSLQSKFLAPGMS